MSESDEQRAQDVVRRARAGEFADETFRETYPDLAQPVIVLRQFANVQPLDPEQDQAVRRALNRHHLGREQLREGEKPPEALTEAHWLLRMDRRVWVRVAYGADGVGRVLGLAPDDDAQRRFDEGYAQLAATCPPEEFVAAVAALLEELAGYREYGVSLPDARRLLAENARLRAALAEFADHGNWLVPRQWIGGDPPWKLAQEALGAQAEAGAAASGTLTVTAEVEDPALDSGTWQLCDERRRWSLRSLLEAVDAGEGDTVVVTVRKEKKGG